MTFVVRTCSDDRVTLARRGALSSTEWQELAGHLAVCADCRLMWRLAGDFEQSALPVPGDELVLERAAKAALARRREGHGALFRFALAASVVLLVAGAASAAVMLRGHLLRAPDVRAEAPHDARAKTRPAVARGAGPSREESPATSAAGAVPRLLEEEPLPPRPPSRKAEAPISKQTTVHPAGVSRRVSPLASFPAAEGAPAIFARAVKEREQGRTSDAIATFRSLQRRFPGTPQAEVSLVSLADLALASGDAAAALEAFDTYLAVAPSGPLATEALLGKARALGSLGRATEADAARAELSRRYPGSPYARPVTGRHTGGEDR